MPADRAEQERVSEMLAGRIHDELKAFDDSRARSKQSSKRILGMSDLGGCREFVRATVAGDERASDDRLKWAAFVGTALGDYIETALAAQVGASIQEYVTLTLPKTGIEVSGSTDVVIFDNHLIDNKTKDRLDAVREDGPSMKYLVQVSGYFVAMVQAGRMTEEGTASLVFYDRSGAQPYPYVVTIGYLEAMSYLEWAEERLTEVAHTLTPEAAYPDANGRYLRDEPESWCFHVKCPFFAQCWDNPDYQPTGVIDAPEHIAAIELYDRGRKMAKAGEGLQREAKDKLGAYRPADEDPVEGRTVDGKWSLKFTLTEGGRYVSRRIDLRAQGR